MNDQTPTQPNTAVKQPASNEGGCTGKGWKKGQSGNPAGRKPKAETLTTCIKEYLEGKPKGEKRTRAQMLAEALVEKALTMEQWAVREVLDRVLGKPKQTVEQTSDDVIRVVYEDQAETP